MGMGLTYRSKQLIEIDRNSTPVQSMHELAYVKNVCSKTRLIRIFAKSGLNWWYE